MFDAKAYSATSSTAPLTPTTIRRRDPTERDVQIEILFCGVCHSDLHSVRDEWQSLMPTIYPIVPGHEIVGRVTEVGAGVTKFRPGDLAAVGCLVDSDRDVPAVQARPREHVPEPGLHLQRAGQPPRRRDLRRLLRAASSSTSTSCCGARANLDLAGAAPLLCAGITTYSPLRRWGVGQGHEGRRRRSRRAGSHGREVRARASVRTWSSFTTSSSKMEDASRLGADEVVVSPRRRAEMEKRAGTLRLHPRHRLGATHDVNAYLDLLAPDGNADPRRRAGETARDLRFQPD